MTGRFYKLCVYPLAIWGGGVLQRASAKQQRIEADLTVAKKSSSCWFWRFLCCLNG